MEDCDASAAENRRPVFWIRKTAGLQARIKAKSGEGPGFKSLRVHYCPCSIGPKWLSEVSRSFEDTINDKKMTFKALENTNQKFN